SHGDNITPPQQALDWILDNYQSVEEIQQCGQRIFYTIDPKVGHLAIFVGTKVAAKDHAEFINNIYWLRVFYSARLEKSVERVNSRKRGVTRPFGNNLRSEPPSHC